MQAPFASSPVLVRATDPGMLREIRKKVRANDTCYSRHIASAASLGFDGDHNADDDSNPSFPRPADVYPGSPHLSLLFHNSGWFSTQKEFSMLVAPNQSSVSSIYISLP